MIPELVYFNGQATQAGANIALRRAAAVRMLAAGHSVNLNQTNVPRTFEEQIYIQQLAAQSGGAPGGSGIGGGWMRGLVRSK